MLSRLCYCKRLAARIKTELFRRVNRQYHCTGWLGSKYRSTGAFTRSFFNSSNALCCSCSQINSTFSFTMSLKGLVLDIFLMKEATKLMTPRKRCGSFLSLGASIARMCSTLSGSIRNPSFVRMCPRYFTDASLKKHLFGFNARPTSLQRLRTHSTRSSCCSSASLQTTISSTYGTTLSMSPKSLSVTR